MHPIVRSLTVSLLLLPGWLVAQVPIESDPRIEEQTRGITSREDTPWEEGAFQLPPYPADDDGLLPVPGQSVASGLAVFIDPESISIGEDGVSRYTAVLTSRRGARNVIYEGIHCSEVSHRVYAYGDGRGGFGEVQDERWTRLKRAPGTYGYRYVLARSVICDQYNAARSPEQVVRRLRYPETVSDEREY